MTRFFLEKLSVQSTKNMILELAQYNNDTSKYTSIDELEELFNKEGNDKNCFNKIIEKCRNFHEVVPLIEDAFGGSFSAGGFGKFHGKILIPKQEIGKLVEAPGIIAFSPYMHTFNYSLSRLYTGIETGVVQDIQTSIVFGIASIEAYINEKAQIWNDNYPNDKVSDSKEDKTSFENKMSDWIPKFTGKKIDKGQKLWNDFKILQKYRDNEIIHQSGLSIGIMYKDILEIANKYRYGIAGILKNLHQLFEQEIPQRIIRTSYLPEISLSNNLQTI